MQSIHEPLHRRNKRFFFSFFLWTIFPYRKRTSEAAWKRAQRTAQSGKGRVEKRTGAARTIEQTTGPTAHTFCTSTAATATATATTTNSRSGEENRLASFTTNCYTPQSFEERRRASGARARASCSLVAGVSFGSNGS